MNSARTLSVLVIDDDIDVRQTLADIVALNGYRALLAANGAEGLAIARRENPTVIITDLAMPVMDGFALLAALHAEEALRSIPVIIVTAKVDRAATRRGMELGADDFITKPFTEEEVIHSIQARLEKKELLDELDAFAHTVAHDLRNPLASLGGRLELAGLMLGKADEAVLRQHLAAATSAAFRLNLIIDELLILSGVRRQSVAIQPLEMGAIATEATERLERLLQQHGARIEKPATWPVAFGHGPWIVEVWANYLSNAAKYSGPNPQIVLGGELRPGGATARFWVRDHGPGLDAAAQARLFVPFSRISSVRADGHGLGLSIVRRILEKLHGTAGVESTPGEGACFWFELPTSAPTQPSPYPPP